MAVKSDQRQRVFILGISSDIGWELAQRYLKAGWHVVGTYRDRSFLERAGAHERLSLFPCDLRSWTSMSRLLERYRRVVTAPWDVFISAVGGMDPIGPFFKTDFKAWEASVGMNALAQLRVLHGLYPARRRNAQVHAAFFAGAGTNNAAPHYSAYCASKIFLIKMCELLDAENEDLNVFIVGPGWVRTKIHAQTLRRAKAAPASCARTRAFLGSDDPGTSHDDIFDCINWCVMQGKGVCGGRNFSVVHDPWRKGSSALARALRTDPDKFKLRRSGNK